MSIKAAAHIFTGVLIIGTLWRVLAYHALAAPTPALQHIGGAMITQY
ncbi:MAG TPA: hypothetical protein VGG50_11505 [Streptosporangiaceae bacterium]|jgi:hypothetical protein